MIEYHYTLQKYQGRSTRHICPNCHDSHSFTLYVDRSNNPISPICGRCDHESSCGYHLTPHQYYMLHPEQRRPITFSNYCRPVQTIIRPATICTIPATIAADATSDPHMQSHLERFLRTRFPDTAIDRIRQDYRLHSTTDGSTIFYQIDISNHIRTAKIMQYNLQTGHRVKDPRCPGRIGWLHCRLIRDGLLPHDWQLTQCLFGEHLLQAPGNMDKPVALVESEKTAVICAAAMPDTVWLATGGKSQLSSDKLAILRHRHVIVFPDLDAHQHWVNTITPILPQCNIPETLIDLSRTYPGLLPSNADLADWILSPIATSARLLSP